MGLSRVARRRTRNLSAQFFKVKRKVRQQPRAIWSSSMPLPRFTWPDLRTIFAKPQYWHARASTADARRRNWTRSFARQIENNEQKFSVRNSREKTPGGGAASKRALQ